jgi:hypothetical protein
MNIPFLSAEIARRIPEMAKDSIINNEALIQRMIESEMARLLFGGFETTETKRGENHHLKSE